MWFKSVSYTHLDVYKRQTLNFLKQHKVEVFYGLDGVIVDLIRLYSMHDLKSIGEPYNHKNYKEYIK